MYEQQKVHRNAYLIIILNQYTRIYCSLINYESTGTRFIEVELGVLTLDDNRGLKLN